MKAKLETIALKELKELAKSQGVKVAGKKKEEMSCTRCDSNDKKV